MAANHLEKPRQLVKSMALANHLLEKGFHITGVQRHRQTNNACYFFDNSEALQDAITDYLNHRNK